MGASILLAVACGPGAPEKRVQIEHRIAPCQIWCDSMFDPDCGWREPSPGLGFDNATECAEMCADPEVGGNWARVDGVDMCKSGFEALADCLEGATCDEQSEFWNSSPFDEYACKQPAYALGDCYTTVSLEAGEG